MLSVTPYGRFFFLCCICCFMFPSTVLFGQDVRQRSLNKFVTYAAAYYQFCTLHQHTTKILKLPSFVSGLDSNEVYSIRELLDAVDIIAEDQQDSLLQFIKESL